MVKSSWLHVVLIACLVVGVSGVVFSETLAERKQTCQDLVNKALDFYQKNGAEKAYAEISTTNGQFVKGEYYVFVYDFAGNCLAHGQFPDRVGKNFLSAADPNGVKTTVEHIKVGKSAKGEGWDVYSFKNPVTKKLGKKTSYIKRVPGKDIIFGAGTYLD